MDFLLQYFLVLRIKISIKPSEEVVLNHALTEIQSEYVKSDTIDITLLGSYSDFVDCI
jgi:hypothetical protein